MATHGSCRNGRANNIVREAGTNACAMGKNKLFLDIGVLALSVFAVAVERRAAIDFWILKYFEYPGAAVF